MISGYSVGTEVKWNDNGGLSTGVITRVFVNLDEAVKAGESITAEVSEKSPVYLVERPDGRNLILHHEDIMLNKSNEHTGHFDNKN